MFYSLNGLLVKWFNTRASQARIHGFETRTDYHIKNKRLVKGSFLCYYLYNNKNLYKMVKNINQNVSNLIQ